MNEPSHESSAPPRSELDRLAQYIEGMKRAWDHEVPTMQVMSEGTPRRFLLEIVDEYFLRAVAYAEGIHVLLSARMGIPALPILRSLYEAHVAFIYLSMKNPQERFLEAQVAQAHHAFYVRSEIRRGRLRDFADGRMMREAEEDIERLKSEIAAEAMALAEKREREWSWTGEDVLSLVETYGDVQEHREIYGLLSLLAHGHHSLVAKHILEWPAEEYERYARDTRLRLRDIRRRTQVIVHLPFSDDAINEVNHGETMVFHWPSASVRLPRP